MAPPTNKDLLTSNSELLEMISAQVTTLNQQIMGNGRAGMLERLTCVEQNLEHATTVMATNTTSIKGNTSAIKELTNIIKTHAGAEMLHLPLGLLQKKVLMWIGVALIVSSAIVGIGGFAWEILSKVIGL